MKKQYILFASILLMANFSALAQEEPSHMLEPESEPCEEGAVTINVGGDFGDQITFLCDEGIRGTVTTYSKNTDITVQFHNAAHPNSESLSPNILTLYNKYWSVQGTYETGDITLGFDPGYLDHVLGYYDFQYLTMAGFKEGKWEIIPSHTGDDTNNDITYRGQMFTDWNININFNDYSAFTLAVKREWNCTVESDIAFPTIADNTFEGTWSAGEPEDDQNLVINSEYTGSLYANSIVLNANIILPDDEYLYSTQGFSGPGKVIMNETNTVSQDNSFGYAPNIQLTKTTAPMKRYDYIFLSNPINDSSTLFNQLLSNNNVSVSGDSIPRPLSAFNQMRTFDAAGMVAINADATNTPVGRGFSATVRNQAPYSTSNDAGAWNLEEFPIQMTINGTANNGTVALAVPNNGWLRIGNPYPEPISAESLFQQFNDKMGKTLYYWTFDTPRGSILANSYNQADFATYNTSGGTQAHPNGFLPDGNIGIMESVLVKSKASTNKPTIYLTNCERGAGGGQKQNTPSAGKGKYRLNLEGSLNSFSQILIAYDPVNGTVDFDNGYDSARLQGQSSELSSLIDNNRHTIQTKGSFSSDDVVNLKLDKRLEETFTITLATTEGLLANTPIFLHDKTLGIYHDLTVAPYAFVQSLAIDTQRFDVVYESPMLNTNTFKTVSAFAFISNNTLNAQANQNISEIAVYDMSGRLIKVFSNIQESLFTASFLNSNGIYIAKIKLSDGTVVSQKLMK